MTTSETEIKSNSNLRHFYLNLFLFIFSKGQFLKGMKIPRLSLNDKKSISELLPPFNPEILEIDFNPSSTFMSENNFQINSESLTSTTQNLCASKLLLRTKTSNIANRPT